MGVIAVRLAALAGAALVVLGVAMVWLPAAVMLAGAVVLATALLVDPERARRARR